MSRASLEEWTLTSSIAFGRDPNGRSWKTWVDSGSLLALEISLWDSVGIGSSLRRST
jgi:hypothetical protein